MTAIRIALADLAADMRRSALTVVSIIPIVAAYLVLLGVAAGLVGDQAPVASSNIILVSPDALDPSAGRLDPAVLDLVPEIGGTDVAVYGPAIFRTIKVDDRIIQLRAADPSEWEDLYRVTVLEGALPRPGADEVAITEGVEIATGWRIGSTVEIYGSRFTVSALVRASGTRFVSVWMSFDRADRLFEGAIGFQIVAIRPVPGADTAGLLERFEAAAGNQYAAFFELDLAERQTALNEVAARISVISTVVGMAALAFAGFNLTALTLAERRRDIAIVRAMGFRRAEIGAVTAIQSIVLSLIAFVIGGLAAWALISIVGPTTLRANVIQVGIPLRAWLLGAAISIATPALGAQVALSRTAKAPIRGLLESA